MKLSFSKRNEFYGLMPVGEILRTYTIGIFLLGH